MEDHLGSSNGYPFESMPEDLKMNMLGELSRTCHEGITNSIPDLSCLETVLGRMTPDCKAGRCWCHKALTDTRCGTWKDMVLNVQHER